MYGLIFLGMFMSQPRFSYLCIQFHFTVDTGFIKGQPLLREVALLHD